MFGISFSEIIIVLLALFIMVGPKKTTEIAFSLGKWIHEFKLKIDSTFYKPHVDLNKPLDQISKTNEKR